MRTHIVNSKYLRGELFLNLKEEELLDNLVKATSKYCDAEIFEQEYLNQVVDTCFKGHLQQRLSNDLKIYEEYIPILLKSLKQEFPSATDKELLQIYLNRKNARA